MDPITSGLIVLAAAAALVAVWYVRGIWDARQTTIVPRLIATLQKGVADIAKFEAVDPNAVAAAAAAAASKQVQLAALKDAISKLS